jgi:hypothetical protein
MQSHGQGVGGKAGAAYQIWLEQGVAAPPAARPAFRLLAGLFVAALLFALSSLAWKWVQGGMATPDLRFSDIPVIVGVGLLAVVFGFVAVFGNSPVWLWRLYLRLSGRL